MVGTTPGGFCERAGGGAIRLILTDSGDVRVVSDSLFCTRSLVLCTRSKSLGWDREYSLVISGYSGTRKKVNHLADTDPTMSMQAPSGSEDEFTNRYGEQIGSGMSAVVYARDGIAAKVYRAGQPSRQVFQEAFTLAAVAEHGIPAPRVYGVETFHDRTVLLMDLVRGESIMDTMLRSPERTGECIDRVVELQVAMHSVNSSHFRPIKLVLMGNIAVAPGLDDQDRNQLQSLLSTLPDGLAVLHGDFHGGNILFDGSSYRIIDWAEVAIGDPAADVARSYLDYLFMDRKDLAEMHLAKYCAATGISRESVLAWLPVMAGSLCGFLPEHANTLVRTLFKK